MAHSDDPPSRLEDATPGSWGGETAQWGVPTRPGRDGAAAAVTFESSFLVGELVAERFLVRRLLGGGGFSEVYAARDVIFDQDVALKVLYPGFELEGPRGLDHLRREVLFARRVTHPQVCRVHDAVIHRPPEGPARLVVTMELLEGPTVEAWLQRHGPLALSRALPWIGQLAEAIDAAHQAGVLHLDLKPGNVILAPARQPGDERRAVITDFGLARPATPGGDAAAAGTPGFMAPEQQAGREVGPAADLYSFAALIHALLTGRPPAEATAENNGIDGDLAPRVRQLLARALAVDPADRFPDAGSLARELRRAAGVEETLPPLSPPPSTPRRSSRLLIGSLLVLAVLVGAATVPVAWLQPSEPFAARSTVPAMEAGRPDLSAAVIQGVRRAREHLRRLDGAAARQALAGLEGEGLGWPAYHAALSDALWILGYEEESRTEARAAYLAAGERPDLDQVERLVHEARWRARAFDWTAAARLYDAAWTYGGSEGADGSPPRRPEVGLELVDALRRSRELDRAEVVLRELRGLVADGAADPRVDLAAAAVAGYRSDNQTLVENARRVVERGEETSAPVLEGEGRRLLGAALLDLQDPAAAREELETARELFTEAGNPSLAASASWVLAKIDERDGDMEGARRRFEEAIEVQREVGSVRRLPVALHAYAALYLRQGRNDAAAPLLEEAHTLFHRLQDLDDVAAVAGDRALLAFNRREVEKATILFEEALDLNRRLGRKRGEAAVLNHLAEVYYGRGEVERAEAAWREGLEAAREAGAEILATVVSANLVDLAWNRGRFEEARSRLDPLLAKREELHPLLGAFVVYLDAKLLLAAGREGRAARAFRRAEDQSRSGGFIEQADLIAIELAQLWSDQERHAAAVDLALDVWQRLQESGNPLYREQGAAMAVSALAAAGRVDEARALVDRIHHLVPTSVERPCARLGVAKAQLALAEGRPEEARNWSRSTLDRAIVDRSLALDLRASTLLARAEEALGAVESGAEVRRRVHARAAEHRFILGCWAYRHETGTVES